MAVFNAYEFVFDGQSSAMYDLMVYDVDNKGQNNVSFGTQADIVEIRTVGRIQPIHMGVNYHTKPLVFKLVFGVKPSRVLSRDMLDRYEMQDIALWLTGHQNYKWLQICQPDISDYQYRCIISDLTPISLSWLPGAFEATVTCDCPYAYSFPFQQQYTLNGTNSILFRNESTTWEYFKPEILYTPFGGGSSLTIINRDDGDHTFSISGIPVSASVFVDNKNGIIQDTNGGLNLYDNFNKNFFRLVRGDNHLTVTGNGVMTISGQFLFNVSA